MSKRKMIPHPPANEVEFEYEGEYENQELISIDGGKYRVVSRKPIKARPGVYIYRAIRVSTEWRKREC